MSSDIPVAESIQIEFKSDQKKLPGRELVLAAVCLANTDGGVIYFGVEDDGEVTVLHPEHMDRTGMVAMIANRTVPHLSLRASLIDDPAGKIAKLEVPRSSRLVVTTDGTLFRSKNTSAREKFTCALVKYAYPKG